MTSEQKDKKAWYQKRIDILRHEKLAQTKQKIDIEGGLDEDDYGRVVPPADFHWNPIPNHPNGSFYGYEGWSENFYALMKAHPVYINPYDAFSGKWMFFLSRMKGSIWNPDYDYSALQPGLKKYDIISGIGSDAHFAPDYKIGLTLGWEGIRKNLQYYKGQNGRECEAFYRAEERTIDAIQIWITHTIEKLGQMADAETDPGLKENLQEMRRINQWVITSPPRTLREACQWICWFNMVSRTYNRDGAGGQLDELLRPYYEADIRSGLIDDDDARFYIACLLLNDTHYYQLGGPDEQGKDMTSHISFLILEAANMINTSCNLTIRVHDGLNQAFFVKSVSYLFTNKNGWPRYSGDQALVDGFIKNGYTRELARKRIAVGCNWMSLPGMEYTLNDLVKINVAKVFEVAWEEFMQADNRKSVPALWSCFRKHLENAVRVTVDSICFHMKYQVYNEPELILNLLSHGPVERGLDVSAGGAQYYNLAIDGAGIAVVADSFAAISRRIEKEHRITWSKLNTCILTDYKGADGEYIRNMMKHVPHYGGGNTDADCWGKKISKLFSDLVHGKSYKDHPFCFIPGWFSWANTIDFGKSVKATPNGRHAGEAINHGANPLPGFRKDGAVTAMANTIADIQPGYGNTAPIQLELDPGLVQDAESVKKIADYIQTIFQKGATLLNINIIDADKILAANKDPAKYPDLVVRVTGFTAYFAMLSPAFRQLVVDRIVSKKQ